MLYAQMYKYIIPPTPNPEDHWGCLFCAKEFNEGDSANMLVCEPEHETGADGLPVQAEYTRLCDSCAIKVLQAAKKFGINTIDDRTIFKASKRLTIGGRLKEEARNEAVGPTIKHWGDRIYR